MWAPKINPTMLLRHLPFALFLFLAPCIYAQKKVGAEASSPHSRTKEEPATDVEQERWLENQKAQESLLKEKEVPGLRSDDALWEALKNSNIADCNRYLHQYPSGNHVQEAKARIKMLWPPVVTPDVRGDMVQIKGGVFVMGDQFGEATYETTYGEEIPHADTLRDFLLSKYEVTMEDFDAFCIATDLTTVSDHGWGRGRHPAMEVSWYEALLYCNWLSRLEKRTPVYTIKKLTFLANKTDSTVTENWRVSWDETADGYRLPTEAEWEYAAREGGKKVRFGNGKDILATSEANFQPDQYHHYKYEIDGVSPDHTIPVDDLRANSLGLKHMAGNVAEWCWDKGRFDNLRSCRGGYYGESGFFCRATYKTGFNPGAGYMFIGFRVARRE